MNIVIFGLTISSSWGNGHATLWRGLCRALAGRGHQTTFFELDTPYYSAHRDMVQPPGCDLRIYSGWPDVRQEAAAALRNADVGLVTSFCPDAQSATRLLLDSNVELKAYYDMDTPVTLHEIEGGSRPGYVPDCGLEPFDLVLSYTGGRALDDLVSCLGARRVAPLYGSVDPDVHRPVAPDARLHANLSYLGTYAADRQRALDRLFLQPAKARGALKFALAGSQYPEQFDWQSNIFYLSHLPPGDHAAFYSSSEWTLNITRGPMAKLGYCPSGRLFEAAACGTPIVSDSWDGLDEFFTPGEEIVVAHDTEDVLSALELGDDERREIGSRARERALDCHTAAARAQELERTFEECGVGSWKLEIGS